MLVAVCEAAAITVLLVGPEHDADRTSRAKVQLLHQPKRLPRRHRSAAVIGRTRADVPRIEMTTDDNDLVGTLAAADFADDVRRISIRQEMRFHRQLETNGGATIDHALQPRGIFGGEI